MAYPQEIAKLKHLVKSTEDFGTRNMR